MQSIPTTKRPCGTTNNMPNFTTKMDESHPEIGREDAGKPSKGISLEDSVAAIRLGEDDEKEEQPADKPADDGKPAALPTSGENNFVEDKKQEFAEPFFQGPRGLDYAGRQMEADFQHHRRGANPAAPAPPTPPARCPSSAAWTPPRSSASAAKGSTGDKTANGKSCARWTCGRPKFCTPCRIEFAGGRHSSSPRRFKVYSRSKPRAAKRIACYEVE